MKKSVKSNDCVLLEVQSGRVDTTVEELKRHRKVCHVSIVYLFPPYRILVELDYKTMRGTRGWLKWCEETLRPVQLTTFVLEHVK